jgi:hypothetical protein
MLALNLLEDYTKQIVCINLFETNEYILLRLTRPYASTGYNKKDETFYDVACKRVKEELREPKLF